ncbi:MAG: U32 family peptidase [Bacteroidota bacterium]
MKKIELLSPAKNYESGIAAINCGADAVYIGASKFSARKAAVNEIKDIEKLTNYAHRYYAKVYAAVNTIFNDQELEEAVALTNDLYHAGVDSLIIQDYGLLMSELPPLPLIASTQMHNNSVEKVKFLESAGFSRAILARELSLQQITDIKKATNIELECFIHGALCVSYSGQCYLSLVRSGRSGNRGDCAQPCRHKYTLTDNEGKIIAQNSHLLSLKDLNLSENITELIDAGITSFKIEGRLKDISYVKNITAFYRNKIDEVITGKNDLTKSSSGKSKINFSPDPYKTFNRDFTKYLFSGKRDNITAFISPKSLGKKIGKVIYARENVIKAELFENLSNGDGICFINHKNELEGFRLNSVHNQLIYPHKMPQIESGTILYRNHDEAFTKLLEKENYMRKIDVEFIFSCDSKNISLRASDEDKNSAEITLEEKFETAKNIEAAKKAVIGQLKKTGDTIFQVSGIDILNDFKYFIPASLINNLRRNVLADLEKERLKNYIPEKKKEITSKRIYPDNIVSYKANILNKKAKDFYISAGVSVVENAPESFSDFSDIELMVTRHCLKYETGFCNGNNAKSNSDNIEQWTLKDEKNEYSLTFDCSDCVMKIKLI